VSKLILKPVSTKDEYAFANDLMAKVFVGNYYKNLALLQSLGEGYPGYLREHTRIALFNGEVAGALRITTDTIRIGEARLRSGGFGWVATHPDFRHKGVARELMADTLSYMHRQGYHVSMLFGIPNFYHRFGFATTLADYSTHIRVAELIAPPNPALLPDVFKGYKVRKCKPGDIPTIQKIHETGDADTACSLLRIRMHYTRRWERWQETRVLTNTAGKVLGYYLPEEFQGNWQIREVGTTDQTSASALLYHLAQWAHDKYLSILRISAPPFHPFIRYVTQFTSTHETLNIRNGEGMMAVLNLEETLESMLPEWESLLAASALNNAKVEVSIFVGRQAFHIRANRGVVDIGAGGAENKLSLSAQDLIHLLSGYRHLEDVLAQKRRILSPAAQEFLSVIFPKRAPYVWPFDRF